MVKGAVLADEDDDVLDGSVCAPLIMIALLGLERAG
jgi:hypothetical protein